MLRFVLLGLYSCEVTSLSMKYSLTCHLTKIVANINSLALVSWDNIMKYIVDYIIFELYWKAKFSPNRTHCNMSNTFISQLKTFFSISFTENHCNTVAYPNRLVLFQLIYGIIEGRFINWSMKDFMIKLVATDMDGTFLDGEGRFDMERLKSLLVSYKEKGIYFAVASGRGILSLKKLFADVRDEVIFIAENGSYVEFHGEDMYEATMSRDFYLSTFEALKKSPYFDERKMLLTGKKACYVLDTVDETYLMFSRHYNENIQKVASLEDITDEIFKFTTNFTEETIEVVEAWVNENVPGVKAMTTGFESIDIVLDYVDKGVAIVELAKKLGLTMDQVMAFGDNLNDLHMMQVVGHPIAPENARAEILELAEAVIGHHKDQSVMTYMEGL